MDEKEQEITRLNAICQAQQAMIVELKQRDKSCCRRTFLQSYCLHFARSGISENRVKEANAIFNAIEEVCK